MQLQSDTCATSEPSGHGTSPMDCPADEEYYPVAFQDVNSRCGVRKVHEVISSFDEPKRMLVKSCGFGGLLKFPLLTHLNRKLAIWLMTKVDESSQTLSIDNCRNFPFSKEDVQMVFGIPASGRTVLQTDAARSDSRIDYVRRCLGLQGKDARCLKEAQDILLRQYNHPMQLCEQDSFKIAFVVFVMAMLLTPSAKHGYSNIEFWPALGKPNDIGTYDWAGYVIYRLLVSVAKLKSDIKKKIRTPLLSGCTIFLQVLYLDSIDLGALNMPHNIFPRAQCFTHDRLKGMAAADVVRMGPVDRNDAAYGASPPRSGNDVCYTWARFSASAQKCSSTNTRLLHAATQLVSSLNIDDEAATPIFLAMMQHRRDVVDLIDEQEVTLLEVIGIIANSYKHGFKYCSPVRGMKRAIEAVEAPFTRTSNRRKHAAFSPVLHLSHEDGTESFVHYGDVRKNASTSRSLFECKAVHTETERHVTGNGHAELPLGSLASLAGHPIHELQSDESPPELTLPLAQRVSCNVYSHAQAEFPVSHQKNFSPTTVNRVMSEYYLWSRECKSLATVHSRAKKTEFEETDEPVVKILARCHQSPLTPWELGQSNSVNVPWLLHFSPKFVELALYDIHQQITARADFDMDFMDICVRRIKQLDDSLYCSHTEYRWRHIMEADFMASILAGRRLTHSPSVRHQLTGTHLSYDIPSCRCIFFPAIVNQRWVCYVWDIAENEVIVYDPLINEDLGNQSISAHSIVVKKLGIAMKQCASYFFEGWEKSWLNPTFQFYTSIADAPPRNRSGVYVAHFCRYFDGSTINPQLTTSMVKEAAATLIYDALHLEGNEGKLPPKFREISEK